ncbi:uncharacterized protein LOC112046319 [Bicyclus anynana]|uniref:Uncharacterized protein LOC112046319 n=1 Tax=Bicyclus anynana TaxID=110368 RepID=A0ABM3LMZ3_BICAN|nr:uncharacterized protein LOC112046319 [Bicyclus anynana]
MIGAMPAVAVRHERRRAEKRGRRPSQLPLQLGRLDDATPSPDHRLRDELYVCGKVAGLYAIVGCLLLGIVVLVVGLVQLSPGAEAAQHRYYLMGAGNIVVLVQLSPGAEAAQHRYYIMGAGAALVGAGVLGAVLRCLCLHWCNLMFQEEYDERVRATQKHCVSVLDSQNHRQDRPKLKPQASVQDVDMIRQPSVASDT